LKVRGHAGVNRIRFRGRVEGKLLPTGTYRLLARAPDSGRIAVIRLVIAERRPDDLSAALAASICPVGDGAIASALAASSDGQTTAARRGGNEGSAGVATPAGDVREGAVLGAQGLGGAAQAVAPERLKVGLLVALLLAAGVLALVALPGSAIPNARVASVIVDRRLELGLTAAVLMAAGMLMYVLTT
jgi:hypothetical protein